MQLICVDPEQVFEFWPHARPLIKAAIDNTGLSDFAEIEHSVLNGDQLLWLVWSGKLEGAGTTHLSKNVCTITAFSGEDRSRWLGLLETIENYARAEGCKCVRLFGRKGWQRVLKDYHAEYVILERPL